MLEIMKKRLCKILLQYYLGKYVKKIQLEQLSIQICQGTGTVMDIELSEEAVNDLFESLNVPVEMVKGSIKKVSMHVPWLHWKNKNPTLDVLGFNMIVRPKQRDAGSMFESMFTSMTTSEQLARKVVEDHDQESDESKFEGVEIIANTIDQFMNRIKCTFVDTVIRFEYVPKDSKQGIAVEAHVDKLLCCDEIVFNSNNDENDSADDIGLQAFSTKILEMMGIKFYTDEFTDNINSRFYGSTDYYSPESEVSFQKSSENFYSTVTSPGVSSSQSMEFSQDGCFQGLESQQNSKSNDCNMRLVSDPIPIMLLPGCHTMKCRYKRNELVPGAKIELELFLSVITSFLCPRQAHILWTLFQGFLTPTSMKNDNTSVPSENNKSKPMQPEDYQRVEEELQKHLFTKKIARHSPKQLSADSPFINQPLDDSDDEHFYAMATSNFSTTVSDMDASYSSIQSTLTHSSASSGKSLPLRFTMEGGEIGYHKAPETKERRRSKPKVSPLQDLLDEKEEDIHSYRIKVSGISLILLHKDPFYESQDTGDSVFSPSQKMKSAAKLYFNGISKLNAPNMFKDFMMMRNKFSEICGQDHLRLIAAPLVIEVSDKHSSSFHKMIADFSFGELDLVECLFEQKLSSTCTESSVTDSSPNYIELLCFQKNEKESCNNLNNSRVRMNVHSVLRSNVQSLYSKKLPRTIIKVELDHCVSELDITIIDRLYALLNTEVFRVSREQPKPYPLNTNMSRHSYFTQALEEGSPADKSCTNIHVVCPSLLLKVRFPIPDLRPDVERTLWWKCKLHKEVLILEMKALNFRTVFDRNVTVRSYSITCKDIHGLFQEFPSDEPLSFLRMTCNISEDGSALEKEEEFDWPRLEIKINPRNPSILEEESLQDSEEPIALNSMDGLYDMPRLEPSPFSSKKVMYAPYNPQGRDRENLDEESSPFTTKSTPDSESKQLVMPGDKSEMVDFQEKTVQNTWIVVEFSIPNFNIVFPSQHMYEVIYNRINNDLFLWEPAAPQVKLSQDRFGHHGVNSQLWSNTHYSRYLICKSALQNDTSSDSEEEEEEIKPMYSVYEQKHSKKKLREVDIHLQSRMTLTVHITQGNLTFYPPVKDESANLLDGKHGEMLLIAEESCLFFVNCYHGNPETRYMCFQMNKFSIYHNSCLEFPLPLVTEVEAASFKVPDHLLPTIYQSSPGITKLTESVGMGTDSLDMFSMAVKISVDTLTPIKEFLIALGIRGATLQHRFIINGQSWLSQFLDFFNAVDYPILGYNLFQIVTEFHLHLWSCALDYRPLYLPLRTLVTVEALSVSSNIVSDSPVTLFRCLVEDGAVYISNKTDKNVVDLQKDYVCVMDMSLFELEIRLSDGKDLKYPRMDMRASNNNLHIYTCADSFTALHTVAAYICNDRDLADNTSDTTSESSVQTTRRSSESTSESPLSHSQMGLMHDELGDAMKDINLGCKNNGAEVITTEEGLSDTPKKIADGDVFLFPDEAPEKINHFKAESDPIEDLTCEHSSGDEEFCIIEDDPGIGITPRSGQPCVRVLTTEAIQILENYFSIPIGKTDLLKAPDHFPTPVSRYTLREMSIIWHIFGGKDFALPEEKIAKVKTSKTGRTADNESSQFSPGKSRVRSSDKKSAKGLSQAKGGPARNHDVLMELQMNKVRFQFELYPENKEQASRQILLVHELEIRDRLASSQINKFLYQYTSEAMPRQTHASMVVAKALHIRPDPLLPAQECCIKVSLLPLRLNIDQDALFFLCNFFSDVTGGKSTEPGDGAKKFFSSKPPSPYIPPIMTVGQTTSPELPLPDPEELLIMLDETMGRAQQMVQQQSEDIVSPCQPIYFRSFVFSPDVPIRLDYHGKRVDMDQGAFTGLLIGLGQLNCSELKLKRLCYRHGLLGIDKLFNYALTEWLSDIKKNQLSSLLGSVGPMHSLVQLVQGFKDLFWLPIEQYRKDGRLVRGLQRGANSFTSSSAMAFLELTNRLVQAVQSTAETAYDMLSAGPSVRKHQCLKSRRYYRSEQPADIREGVTSACIVLREGFGDAVGNLVKAATQEHEQKGMSGAVGGVLRQIPPIVVKPVIVFGEATSNLLGGVRNQLAPDARKEAAEKWRSAENE